MPSTSQSLQERTQGFLAEKGKRKRQALWLLLFFVCVGIYWFSHWETERSPMATSRSTYPSFIIYNFKSDAFDEQGKRSYQIQADSLTFFEDTGLSHLKQPTFIVSGDSQREGWQTTAEEGIVINNKEIIQLRRNVKIRTQSSQPNTYKITTPSLDLYPEQHLASTHEPVTIDQAQHNIRSIGLKANWHEGELQLTQEVRAYYETTP